MKSNNILDKEKFIERLRLIAQPNPGAFAAKCEGISDQLFRSYLAGAVPGIDKVIVIAEQAGVSLDWLLTGKENHHECPVGYDKDLQEICKALKMLLESETKWGELVKAGINACKEGHNNQYELVKLKNRINEFIL